MLKKNGVKIDEDEDAPDEPSGTNTSQGNLLDAPRAKVDQGILFADRQNSRYVEKYG